MSNDPYDDNPYDIENQEELSESPLDNIEFGESGGYSPQHEIQKVKESSKTLRIKSTNPRTKVPSIKAVSFKNQKSYERAHFIGPKKPIETGTLSMSGVSYVDPRPQAVSSRNRQDPVQNMASTPVLQDTFTEHPHFSPTGKVSTSARELEVWTHMPEVERQVLHNILTDPATFRASLAGNKIASGIDSALMNFQYAVEESPKEFARKLSSHIPEGTMSSTDPKIVKKVLSMMSVNSLERQKGKSTMPNLSMNEVTNQKHEDSLLEALSDIRSVAEQYVDPALKHLNPKRYAKSVDEWTKAYQEHLVHGNTKGTVDFNFDTLQPRTYEARTLSQVQQAFNKAGIGRAPTVEDTLETSTISGLLLAPNELPISGSIDSKGTGFMDGVSVRMSPKDYKAELARITKDGQIDKGLLDQSLLAGMSDAEIQASLANPYLTFYDKEDPGKVKEMVAKLTNARDVLKRNTLTHADIADGSDEHYKTDKIDPNWSEVEQFRNEAALFDISYIGDTLGEQTPAPTPKGSKYISGRSKTGKSSNTDARQAELSDSEVYVQLRQSGLSEEEAYEVMEERRDGAIKGKRNIAHVDSTVYLKPENFVGPSSIVPSIESVKPQTDQEKYRAKTQEGLMDGTIFPQRTPEWHQQRVENPITSTRVGKTKGVKGLNKTAMDIAMEKEGLGEKFVTTEAMRRGTELEPYAQALYEDITGKTVEEAYFQSTGDGMGASPDGFTFDKDGNFTNLNEFKVHSSRKAQIRAAETNQYYDQMQWHMRNTGAESVDYFTINTETDDYILKNIPRDDDHIRMLEGQAKKALDKSKSITREEVIKEKVRRATAKSTNKKTEVKRAEARKNYNTAASLRDMAEQEYGTDSAEYNKWNDEMKQIVGIGKGDDVMPSDYSDDTGVLQGDQAGPDAVSFKKETIEEREATSFGDKGKGLGKGTNKTKLRHSNNNKESMDDVADQRIQTTGSNSADGSADSGFGALVNDAKKHFKKMYKMEEGHSKELHKMRKTKEQVVGKAIGAVGQLMGTTQARPGMKLLQSGLKDGLGVLETASLIGEQDVAGVQGKVFEMTETGLSKDDALMEFQKFANLRRSLKSTDSAVSSKAVTELSSAYINQGGSYEDLKGLDQLNKMTPIQQMNHIVGLAGNLSMDNRDTFLQRVVPGSKMAIPLNHTYYKEDAFMNASDSIDKADLESTQSGIDEFRNDITHGLTYLSSLPGKLFGKEGGTATAVVGTAVQAGVTPTNVARVNKLTGGKALSVVSKAASIGKMAKVATPLGAAMMIADKIANPHPTDLYGNELDGRINGQTNMDGSGPSIGGYKVKPYEGGDTIRKDYPEHELKTSDEVAESFKGQTMTVKGVSGNKRTIEELEEELKRYDGIETKDLSFAQKSRRNQVRRRIKWLEREAEREKPESELTEEEKAQRVETGAMKDKVLGEMRRDGSIDEDLSKKIYKEEDDGKPKRRNAFTDSVRNKLLKKKAARLRKEAERNNPESEEVKSMKRQVLEGMEREETKDHPYAKKLYKDKGYPDGSPDGSHNTTEDSSDVAGSIDSVETKIKPKKTFRPDVVKDAKYGRQLSGVENTLPQNIIKPNEAITAPTVNNNAANTGDKTVASINNKIQVDVTLDEDVAIVEATDGQMKDIQTIPLHRQYT